MLTGCPQCFAWFRVRAEHLSVANGLVTCGRCEHVFNALSSLIEEGTAAQSPVPPKIEPTEELAEAQARSAPLSFVTITATPTITPPRVNAAPALIMTTAAQSGALPESPHVLRVNDDDSAADVSLPAVVAEQAAFADELPMVNAHAAELDQPPPEEPADSLDIGPVSTQLDDLDISDFDFSAIDDEQETPSPAARDEEPHLVIKLAEDDDERDETDPNYRAKPSAAPAALTTLPLLVPRDDEYIVAVDDHEDDEDHTGPRPEPEVPAVLLDDLVALGAAPRPSAWRGVAWTLFGWMLAALVALQLAFIERQPLLARVPDAAPLIDSLCARLPCLERRQLGPSVRLLARDVREHPSYRDALLVNATIVNDAKTPSPYPVIDLRLRDAAGNVLSARQFQPLEYLDQSIAIDAGMPSDRPVYIVLELAGNASNAVSFEFTFL